MYGHRCSICGAYLDPGEKCDCMAEENANKKAKAPAGKTETFTQISQADDMSAYDDNLPQKNK